MFSGIVECTGKVKEMKQQDGGAHLVVELGAAGEGLKDGDSVAVNGVCLTAVSPEEKSCSFNVITETLSKTNLGVLTIGSEVNIERSLRAGDRVEGHFVQGHVQATGKVTNRIDTDKEFKLWISAGEIEKYIAPLGCIAVNGVSLTVAEVRPGSFAVALIPTTLERTNLGKLKVDEIVNLEPDILSRQIVHWLESQ
jgi:riboflavin synthase